MSIARAAWLAAAVLAVIALAGCATAPQSPPGAAEARAKLDRLQADSDLASRAPIEIKEADAAVRLAETPVPQDEALGIYRVYLADHKVEIAAAKASTRYAEDQRVELAEAREGARLKARTLEAETARNRARLASSDAAMARDEADAARASAAVAAADAARRAELVRSETDLEKAELQRQIDLLQAKTTERGLVLTLGNVLFATGRSDLKTSGQDSLNKLVTFLNQYEDRNILIEGHTDNVGSDANNMVLSTSRADSVQAYLLQQGIGGQRISATGMGESQPAASNDTETGRQENRRVEIVILNSSGQVTALNPSGQ
ncbi:MAG TPA: OmpA family protein [Xanthomonadales bacterium]|nr:OmpA family protein [Xanthomonadales bacterium]